MQAGGLDPASGGTTRASRPREARAGGTAPTRMANTAASWPLHC